MKKKSKIRMLVVAGGSGGHIFPALGLCQELDYLCSKGHFEIYFVSSSRQKAARSIPANYHPVYLSEGRSLFCVLKLLVKCVFLMIKISPDIVFGFGGFLSVPYVVAGRLLGAKIFIHEQNVVPGRANLFLAGFAHKIGITFSQSKDYFLGHAKKVVLTKYPLRKSLCRLPKRDALDFFGFQEGFLTVLVMGGSQGAHRINELFLQALKENGHLEQYQILHLCGESDFAHIKREYAQLPVRSKIFAFLAEMNYAYSAADIVFSRAGASSIVEMAYFGLPSVLIPYPYAGAHQLENARILSRKGASLFLEEDKVTPALISGLLDIFSNDQMRKKTMSFHAASFFDAQESVDLSQIIFL
ncbi:MAG: UDP-N-acetylglucosamine--N-acetylmuramyl-(pentapeptide) pyrophosphoryl-undecaprenol N-acetylglucosamine transferase [Candidatus Omnitrophota bacterium]